MAALSTSSPWYLTVSAGRLKDGSNANRNLVGVNVYGGCMPYQVAEGNGQTWGSGPGQLNEQCKWMSRLDVLTAMKTQLGASLNVVRVPFSPLMFNPLYTEQLLRMNDFVSRCATLGIWVMMTPYGMAEYGDFASRKSTDGAQDETNATAITAEVMTCHTALAAWTVGKDNVLINLLNEPRLMTGATWQTQTQAWIANLRTEGYARPIFIDGPSWATELDLARATTIATADTQVVFLAHHYEDSGQVGVLPQGGAGSFTFWPGYIAAKNAGLAVGLGEFGARVVTDLTYPGPQTWATTCLTAYGDVPVKIAWMWPPHDSNSMVGNWRSGVWSSIAPGAVVPPPLNEWGAFLADKLFGVTSTYVPPTLPGINAFGGLKVALAPLRNNLQQAAAATLSAVSPGRVRIMRGAVVCADGSATPTVDGRYDINVPASTLSITQPFTQAESGLAVAITNAAGTSGFSGPIDGLSFAVNAGGSAGGTVSVPALKFQVETTSVRPTVNPPAPPPVPPPTTTYVLAQPPETVDDWLYDNTVTPRIWPVDAVGLHDSPGGGRGHNVPFGYGASRNHDRWGRYSNPSTQWRNLEPQRGVDNWTGLDEWIDDNLGKDLTYCLNGTPQHQSLSQASWGWPNYPGGAAPPTDMPAVTAFVQRFYAHVLATYGSHSVVGKFEVWNEPGNNFSSTSLDVGVPGNKFWQGTPNQLADLHVAVKNGLPPGIKLVSCAWEGQSSDHAGSGQRKLITAMKNRGRMSDIDIVSKHGYVYDSPANWTRIIGEIRGHLGFLQADYKPGVTLIDSEFGGESSSGVESGKFGAYTDGQKAGTIRCCYGANIAMGVTQVHFYIWRNQTNEDLPLNSTMANTAMNEMHLMGGARIYRCGRTENNNLWISYITAAGVQRNQLWRIDGSVVNT